MNSLLVMIGLTLLAGLSPLLTFARLWQLKEWRWDRLREHMRSFGWLRQLFGVTRPVILVLMGVIGFFGFLTTDMWIPVALSLLGALSAVQILLKKQPLPVWTEKAMTLTVTSLLLLAAASIAIARNAIASVALPFLPLLAPFILMISWTLWKPADFLLKQRIMRKASRLRSQYPRLTVIGVTGSAGKTTTKELLARVLHARAPLITPEHVNSEMGVAAWLLRELPKLKRDEERILIIEMGAYTKGEIAFLCRLSKPSIGVLTSIGLQHLALFGSREALRSAKAEILLGLPKDGHAFVNGDNEECRAVAKLSLCPVTLVGTGGHLDLEAFDIEETTQGIRFRADGESFSVPMHGTHNVTNVLLAIAVGKHLGVSAREAASPLRTYQPLKKTFELREEHGVFILDDTHNASPGSFETAIEWARAHPAEKKILLTSGLIELGEEEEKVHTKLGADSSLVFSDAIFTQKKGAEAFQKGFGKNIHVLRRGERFTTPKGALLVCIGFVSPALIKQVLPESRME